MNKTHTVTLLFKEKNRQIYRTNRITKKRKEKKQQQTNRRTNKKSGTSPEVLRQLPEGLKGSYDEKK